MAAPGTLLANVSPDDLIEAVANGAIPARLAQQYGVTKAAVYYHLADHPLYQKARQTGMAIRLDEAEAEIADSADQLTLSRARESFRAVAWRAEREHPQQWGATSRVTGADGGPVQVQLVQFVIQSEQVSVSSAQQQASETGDNPLVGESKRVSD